MAQTIRVSVPTTTDLKHFCEGELKDLIKELKFKKPEEISYPYIYSRLQEILGGTRHEFFLNPLKLGTLREENMLGFIVNIYLTICGLGMSDGKKKKKQRTY